MSKITKKQKEAAKKAMTESLPNLVKFLKNPECVAAIEKEGYRLNVPAIFKTFTDAAGWKVNMNEVFIDKKAENGR